MATSIGQRSGTEELPRELNQGGCMGALIQTKGTQLLARFFSSQFGAGTYDARSVNLNWMRNNPSDAHGGPGGGASQVQNLINDFGLIPYGGAKINPLSLSRYFLYDLSQNYSGLGPNSTDLFYPPLTANPAGLDLTTGAAIQAGDGQLTFALVPSWVRVGMTITDTRGAIAPNTTVQNPITATYFAISANAVAAAAAGDQITFSDPNHANLLARWQYYLQYEMQPAVHDTIRQGIYLALVDGSVKNIKFDAVEHTVQTANISNEYEALPSGGKLDDTRKHMRILLLTSATKSPTNVDSQT